MPNLGRIRKHFVNPFYLVIDKIEQGQFSALKNTAFHGTHSALNQIFSAKNAVLKFGISAMFCRTFEH